MNSKLLKGVAGLCCGVWLGCATAGARTTEPVPPRVIVEFEAAPADLLCRDLARVPAGIFPAAVTNLLGKPEWSSCKPILRALLDVSATGILPLFRNDRQRYSAVAERRSLYNTLVITLPGPATADAVEKFRALSGVVYAEADASFQIERVPADPFFLSVGSWGQLYDDLWALKNDKLAAEFAWDVSQGQGITVAVLDSGVDYNHPDLQGQMWSNPGDAAGNGVDEDRNGLVDDARGWNFQDGSGDTMDQNGHGTFVAGIIAAAADNFQGIAGVAYRAKIMPLVVANDRGVGNVSDAAAAIVYAVDKGARVINVSFGGYEVARIVKKAVDVACQGNAVVVCSAGNEAVDQFHTPSDEFNAISVAASDPRDRHCDFSNYGYKLDVCAPGGDADPLNNPDNILSLVSAVHDPRLQPNMLGQQYVRLKGTSASAPYVAGAVALILSLHPNYTVDEVRSLLRASAEPADGAAWTARTGYGRIQLDHLVRYPGSGAARIQTPSDRHTRIRPADAQAFSGKAYARPFTGYKLEWGEGESPLAWNQFCNSPVAQPAGALGQPFVFPAGAGPLKCVQLTTEGVNQRYIDRVWITVDPYWQWTKLWGSAGGERGRDVAIDANGNIYVLYQYLDAGAGLDHARCLVKLVKYNANGNRLWERVQGAVSTLAGGVACDAQGNVFVCGATGESLDGQPNQNLGVRWFDPLDAFVCKYDSAGTWKWTRIRGSPDAEEVADMVCDAAGNVYLSGSTKGNFDGQVVRGDSDLLVMKYDGNGNWRWTQMWGTPNEETGAAIALDANGNALVAGSSGIGPFYDVFMAKYTPAGAQQMARVVFPAVDGTGYVVKDLVQDADWNIYITGGMYDANWNRAYHADPLSAQGFVMRFSRENALQWKRAFGGIHHDFGYAIATIGADVVVGATEDLPEKGGEHMQLYRYAANGNQVWRDTIPANHEYTTTIAAGGMVSKNRELWLTGDATGPIDGKPFQGISDAYLMKYQFPN